MAVLRHGEVFGGVVYSSSLTTTGVTFPDGWTPGPPTEPFPIYWEGAESAMHAMSNALAAYDNAIAADKEYSVLWFKGSDAELNVFSVNASEFLSTYEYYIDVPPGATTIINVSGASPEIKYAGFRGNFTTDKLLWNFPDATTLTLRSVGFPGSILAPSAAADMQNGDLRGTVVVASAYANVQLYMAPFDTPKVGGCLAIDPLWSCSDDTKVDDWGRAVALDSEAGFLQINSEEYIAEGEDRTSPTHRIWYSFHPAKQYPKSKPLAVFFNGGPGTATSQILFSLNTGPKTLDPQRTGAQPIAKNDIADWSEFANLLYIDSPAAGFSYPIKNPDGSAPRVGTDMDRDAAIFVQVVLRFLLHHRMLVDNNVIVVGESYGGARSILMHDHLFKYASLTDPSSPFQDTQLHADLMGYFSVVFGTQTPSAGDIATQWGHQVLIQPVVAGLEQRLLGDAIFLDESSENCLARECWYLDLEENPDTACDERNCDKPRTWRDEIDNTVEQRLTTVAILHAALGVDPRTIEWMSAAARVNAYGRSSGPSSAETPDMENEFGELMAEDDSYYVRRNGDALDNYPSARYWDSQGAGELSATQFVEGLYNGVETFITVARYDSVVPTVGIPHAIQWFALGSGPVSDWIYNVWYEAENSYYGLARSGVMILGYQPCAGSPRHPVASRRRAVVVVQAPEHRHGDDLARITAGFA
jgi:choice-of-anchor A domain-containing protein